MPDHRLAVQVAVLQALSAPAGASLAPVHQHVPEKTQPPLTVIGRIEVSPAGGKDGGLDQIAFEIEHYVREPSRAPLYARMATARGLIEDAALPAQAGVLLSRPAFESDSDDLMEDGATYAGVQRFTLFAQPAN